MKPSIIQGGVHTDHRGTLHFMNEFDMSPVKRFYTVTHSGTAVKRGWRGHKIEQRWFYVVNGGFEIELVKLDDWISPSKTLQITSITISSLRDEVLHVPAGHATCLRAFKENSTLMVFSDFGMENSKLDDYLWPNDYFNNK